MTRGVRPAVAASKQGEPAAGTDPVAELLPVWQRPYFDPVAVAPDTVSVAVTGIDPLGPRALALWRVSGAAPVRIGESESDSRQRFDFGQVLVPSEGVTVAVTAAGPELQRPPESDLLFLELALSTPSD